MGATRFMELELPPMLPPGAPGCQAMVSSVTGLHNNETPVITQILGWYRTSLDCEMVGETGIEPVTPDLEGPCSIQLSYSPQCNDWPKGWARCVTPGGGRAAGKHPLNRL